KLTTERRREQRTIAARPRRLRPTVTVLEGRALLSTLTVTNTDDSGAGTLRAAVNQANSENGGDTIVFSSLFHTPQTITLTSGPLTLSGPATTINGPGAAMLTISGGEVSQVIDVEGGFAAISGLTISGGRANHGGGLINKGANLSLTSVTITGNSATTGGGLF